MSHGPDSAADAQPVPPLRGWLGRYDRTLVAVNRALYGISMLALMAGACVLTLSVVLRYFIKVNTDWQDEAAVMLLVGATFLSGATVQGLRGHVAIEALRALLPPRANAIRQMVVDLISFGFCGFFSWKSWTLFHEAWAEGQTSPSTWAPPLWIPYSLMAVGMTLITLQILLQVLARFQRGWGVR